MPKPAKLKSVRDLDREGRNQAILLLIVYSCFTVIATWYLLEVTKTNFDLAFWFPFAIIGLTREEAIGNYFKALAKGQELPQLDFVTAVAIVCAIVGLVAGFISSTSVNVAYWLAISDIEVYLVVLFFYRYVPVVTKTIRRSMFLKRIRDAHLGISYVGLRAELSSPIYFHP